MKKFRKMRGFTIMEMIIVCMIIAVLLGIFMPSFFSFRAKQRARMSIRMVLELKKAFNGMAQECKGYPIRDDITDESEFTAIIDTVECMRGKTLPAPYPIAWPMKSPCGSTIGKMLGVETQGGANALCKPACEFKDDNCFDASGRSVYSATGFGISESFVYVNGDECSPTYNGAAFGGGSPGWNYALLKNPADTLDQPVGVICAIGLGFRQPVKVVINTGGSYNGRSVQDGSGIFGITGSYLGASACPCGPWCENMKSGEKGCCAPCQNKAGIGYKY